jgi:hypothetical protein
MIFLYFTFSAYHSFSFLLLKKLRGIPALGSSCVGAAGKTSSAPEDSTAFWSMATPPGLTRIPLEALRKPLLMGQP